MVKICQICDKDIKLSKESYLDCKKGEHFYHKGCLKKQYKKDYDAILDAGYIYASGSVEKYKKHKCLCKESLKIHNNLLTKMKKLAKVITLTPVVAIAVILAL
jgi:hypothetical protein